MTNGKFTYSDKEMKSNVIYKLNQFFYILREGAMYVGTDEKVIDMPSSFLISQMDDLVSQGKAFVLNDANKLAEQVKAKAGFVAYHGFTGLFDSVLNLALEMCSVARVNIHHTTIDFKDGSVISFHESSVAERGYSISPQDARY